MDHRKNAFSRFIEDNPQVAGNVAETFQRTWPAALAAAAAGGGAGAILSARREDPTESASDRRRRLTRNALLSAGLAGGATLAVPTGAAMLGSRTGPEPGMLSQLTSLPGEVLKGTARNFGGAAIGTAIPAFLLRRGNVASSKAALGRVNSTLRGVHTEPEVTRWLQTARFNSPGQAMGGMAPGATVNPSTFRDLERGASSPHMRVFLDDLLEAGLVKRKLFDNTPGVSMRTAARQARRDLPSWLLERLKWRAIQSPLNPMREVTKSTEASRLHPLAQSGILATGAITGHTVQNSLYPR